MTGTVLRIALALLLAGCTSKPHVLAWRGLKNSALKIKDYREEFLTKDTATFTSRFEGFNVKIIKRSAGEEDAKTLWKGLRIQTEGMYKDYPAPYPGFVSRKIGCEEKFKPKPAGHEDSRAVWKEALLLFSNDRFTFGGCTEDGLTKRALVGAVFCKDSHSSYEIKIFQDSFNRDFSDIEKIFKGFDCATP
jgi:hypothetical protein